MLNNCSMIDPDIRTSSTAVQYGAITMVLIGLGANTPSTIGPPIKTLMAAIGLMKKAGISCAQQSNWYESAPVPISDQAWFLNGVLQVETDKQPETLLQYLHDLERAFGRDRRMRNEPRPIDLDLLAFGSRVIQGGCNLPHPRMHERAFVLLPLREIAPNWLHPLLQKTITELIAELPKGQETRVMER